MKSAWILLPLLLALALALRERRAEELSVAPDEAAEVQEAPAWLFDDAAAALVLRRVELALAADRLPAADRMLAFPDLREVPGLPVFPGLLAITSEMALARPGGHAALGGVDERRLERLLAHVPPVLGVLATLLVFVAAGSMAHGRSKFASAMLAAGVFAVAPVTVRAGEVAHLGPELWPTLLTAALLALADRAYHARDSLDRVQAALLAGVVTGTALASSPLGLLLFAAAWSGYLAAATHTDQLRAHTAQREGLLFCLVAAGVSLVAALEGPWEVFEGGLTARAARGVTGFVALGCVPFLLGAIPLFKRAPRALRVAIALVVVGGSAAAVPGVGEGLVAALRLLREERDLSLVGAERGPLAWGPDGLELARLLRELTPLALLYPFAWVLAASRWPRPERVMLLVLGLGLGALAVLERGVAPVFVVPLAITLGVVADDESRREEAAVRRRFVPVLAALVLGAHAVAPFLGAGDVARRAERVHFLNGLRWMRTNTPSPGAWNAPATAKQWGVLAAPSFGPLVAFHARRPAVASGGGIFLGSERGDAVARALLAADPGELARRARVLGAEYVVVAPRMLRDARRLEAVAAELFGEDAASGPARLRKSALWALTFPGEEARETPDLVRVYAAPLRVTPDGRAPVGGEPAGPAISVWRVEGGPPPVREGGFRAR